MAAAGKRYTKEFKEQACRLVLGGTHDTAEAARELGLPYHTLSSWLRRSGRRPPGRQALDLESDDPAVLKAKLRDLQKQLDCARMERDILKKATAFFASHNP